jgi:hypothetical protein
MTPAGTARMVLALPLLAAGLLVAGPAAAQMPDLRAIAGKPLPVGDLPSGTVVVRLARQTVQNPVAGAEVSAIIAAPEGEARKRTAKSGPDGRATFEAVPGGSGFQASVTIDGETLTSERFTVPASGGVRVMLVAGLSAAGAGAAPGGEAPAQGKPETFRMGASTGRVASADDLAPGTLELLLRDEAGGPLMELEVRLGQMRLDEPDETRKFQVRRATSDQLGRVRFTDLPTGEGHGYAAVIEHNQTRLSTEPFRMPAERGMRGQIAALRRTADRSVLRMSEGSRLIIYTSEDSLTFMVVLGLQNGSKEIFDPGPEGLLLPVPEGAVGLQEIPGGAEIEVVAGAGVKLRTPVPPDSPGATPTEVRFGYIMHTDGASSFELRQPMPVLMPEPLIIVPIKNDLSVEASGLKYLREDASGTGEKVKLYTLPTVAAGGTLSLNVSGYPTRDKSGAMIAAVLCLALVGGAIIWGRAPRARAGRAAAGTASHDQLLDQREKLFAELCEIERQRRSASTTTNGVLDDKRRDVVSRLEKVYRELATG